MRAARPSSARPPPMPVDAPPAPRPAVAARSADVASALDALRRVVRELRVAAGRAASETGLSAAQLFVLQQVAAVPAASLTELAELTLTDRTSVAAVVERLHERGLVARARAATDRRRVEIRLTRAGVRVLARAPHAPTRRVLGALDALADDELRRLAAGLADLTRAMGIAETPAAMLFDDAGALAGARGAQRALGARTSRVRR